MTYEPLSSDLLSTLPSTSVPGSIALVKRGYTTEAEIRERVIALAMTPLRRLTVDEMSSLGDELALSLQKTPTTLSDDERLQLAEKWISRLCETQRKRGMLMTEQQAADFRLGVKLQPGMRAKYVGPARVEHTAADLLVPREPGQLGVIVAREEDRQRGVFITFHPFEAVAPMSAPGVEAQNVELQVREHTPGWLTLERVPL